MDLTGADTRLLTQLLSAASLRARVIAGNVSNQNTPGYRRQVVQFESLIEDAVREGRPVSQSQRPLVVEDRATPAGPDGNNVHLELEMSSARENRLLYEAYATILQGHLGLIEHSITGGR